MPGLASLRCPLSALSRALATVLSACAPQCSRRVVEHALLLGGGAVLVPGPPSITSVRRVLGKSEAADAPPVGPSGVGIALEDHASASGAGTRWSTAGAGGPGAAGGAGGPVLAEGSDV
jgi:hypothetical protein